MRLEQRRVRVRGLRFGAVTEVRDGTLQVCREEALAAVADPRFASLALDLACPGESVRILPVKDVVEPRAKLEGGKGYFPGFCAPMGSAGEGVTLVLEGAAVVTCGPVVGFQEGFIDMRGPGADYTPFSGTCNVVLSAVPREGLEPHGYEAALRMAGLRLATYLAGCCAGAVPEEVRVYERGSLPEVCAAHPDLPRVLYLCMSITQGLLHDTYVYGVDLKRSLPTLLHPNEVLDGALVSGNCVSACDKNTTFHHVNDPVVQALYRRHGVDLVFLGVVPTLEDVMLEGKLRAASMNLNLARSLGAQGVVVTEEGYGNPDTDLCLNARGMERAGIRVVVIADEAAGTDGASQSLADATPEMDAFVSTGNVNERIWVPPMERVLGDPRAIAVLSGGSEESLAPDGSMTVELQSVIGSTNEQGFSRLGCEWI